MRGRLIALATVTTMAALASVAVWAQSAGSAKPAAGITVGHGSQIVQEAGIAVKQPGPHEGGGETTAFPFFASAPGFKLNFRKRILHKGSAIGYHEQREDEVYYVLSGLGEFTLNGVKYQVGPGTAMLTRPGDSHGIRPAGDGEVTILIAY